MDGHHGVLAAGADVEVSAAVPTHSDGGSCASSAIQVAGNDVTVLTLRESGLQSLIEVKALQVENNEGVSTAAKSDLIVGSCPPVPQRLYSSDVPVIIIMMMVMRMMMMKTTTN